MARQRMYRARQLAERQDSWVTGLLPLGRDHMGPEPYMSPTEEAPSNALQESRFQANFASVPIHNAPRQRNLSHETHLPTSLKTSVETLSGIAMDDVNVHYNSSKPAQLKALAYTQGTNIYVGPGQASHLPHEAWHVVQQKQGRVQPTTLQGKGNLISAEPTLEQEADQMGEKASRNLGQYSSPPTLHRGSPSSSIKVIQRYKEATADEYEIRRDEEEAQAMFTVQSPTPILTDVGDPLVNYPRYQFQAKSQDVKPNLNVADDETLAIQKESEPKEFYATNQVVANANEALEEKGSVFRLNPKGHRLTLNDQELRMIAPRLHTPDARAEAEIFGSYFTSICRDFATKVMNSSKLQHEAIFQAASGRGIASTAASKHQRAIDTSSALTSAKVRNLASTVVNDDASTALRNTFEMDDIADNDTATGQSYGTALRQGNLQDKTQQLGLNEFAAPAVGEGFATYTTPADTDLNGAMLDYSAGDPPVPRPNIWGYHYAGVVATSETGTDRITLENYNRAEDIDASLQQLYDSLLQTHRQVVEEAINSLLDPNLFTRSQDIPFQVRFREAYKAVRVAQGSLGEDALQGYLNLMEQRNDSQAWFFQIYGSQVGQTFHERQAASGFFANPMTVRVGQIPEAVDRLHNTLPGKLDRIPGVVNPVVDLPAYATTLQTGKRQLKLRTTPSEVKSVYNNALEDLVRMRVFVHIDRTTIVAQTEGVENIHGYSMDAVDSLIQGLQQKRNALGFFDFSDKSRLDNKITQIHTLRNKVQALLTYRDNNREP